MDSRSQVEQHLLSRPRPNIFPNHVVLPDYEAFSIAGIPRLIETLFGLSDTATPLLDVADFPSVERVILLILDGLGYRKTCALLEAWPDLVLHDLTKRGRFLPITSVFPSTTVAALTTYSTGLAPLAHGMIGYRLYLRETSAITNMIRFSLDNEPRGDSALDAGLNLDTLLPRQTVYERLEAGSVTTHTLLPRQIVGSGLSRLLYRGCTHVHSAVSLPDMFVTARQILEHTQGKTLLTLYWPGLDSVAHVRGPETDSYTAEMLTIDTLLRRELVNRVDNTLLIMSSDHGFVPMEASDYRHLADLTDLADATLRPPAGEPRASYLYLQDRAIAEPSNLPRLLDGDLLRLTAAEVLDHGLLGRGTRHPEIEHRLGDLNLVSTGRAGLYEALSDAPLLRGMHGGLTEAEMLVPLIVTPL